MTAHYLDRFKTPDRDEIRQQAADEIRRSVLSLRPGESLMVERPITYEMFKSEFIVTYSS